jgi:bifunctional DNase/RNase
MICAFPNCINDATHHFIEIESRSCKNELHFCNEHARGYSEGYPWQTTRGAGLLKHLKGYACFDLELVYMNEDSDEQVIYLRESQKERLFSFKTGICEAQCIAFYPKGIETQKPLTHKAMIDLFSTIGVKVLYGIVEGLEKNEAQGASVFHAKLVISLGEKVFESDMRVSDVLILALVGDVPFFVSDKIQL